MKILKTLTGLKNVKTRFHSYKNVCKRLLHLCRSPRLPRHLYI